MLDAALRPGIDRLRDLLFELHRRELPKGAHAHACPTCCNYFVCFQGPRDSRGQVDGCGADGWTCPDCDDARRDAWLQGEAMRTLLDDTTATELQQPAYRDRLLAAMRDYQVPESWQRALADYIIDGSRVGSFLEAVLNNDLREAIGRGDLLSRLALYEIVTFLHNQAPAQCWGREDAAAEWIAAHAARRKSAEPAQA